MQYPAMSRFFEPLIKVGRYKRIDRNRELVSYLFMTLPK